MDGGAWLVIADCAVPPSRPFHIRTTTLPKAPAWLVGDALAAGTLVRVVEEPVPYGYALQAVWPHARALPLKTRAAIDLLASRLPPLLAQGGPRAPSAAP